MRSGKRRRFTQIWGSPLTLVAVAILFIVLARAAWSIHQKSLESAVKLTQAQAELVKLQGHEKDLETQVGLMSSQQGIESELRSRYPAVKPGESVAVIVNNDNGQSASVESAVGDATSTPSISWWRRVLHFIGL